MVHPSREKEFVERRSKGLSHCDKKEEIEETLLSPKDRGSVVKPNRIPVKKGIPAEYAKIPSEYWKIFMAPTTSTIDFPIRHLGTGTNKAHSFNNFTQFPWAYFNRPRHIFV